MATKMRQVEAGEWCDERESVLKAYAAGIADRDQAQQAEKHIAHCKQCSEFVGSPLGSSPRSGQRHRHAGSARLARRSVSIPDRIGEADRSGSRGRAGRQRAKFASSRHERSRSGCGRRRRGRQGRCDSVPVASWQRHVSVAGLAATACVAAGIGRSRCRSRGREAGSRPSSARGRSPTAPSRSRGWRPFRPWLRSRRPAARSSLGAGSGSRVARTTALSRGPAERDRRPALRSQPRRPGWHRRQALVADTERRERRWRLGTEPAERPSGVRAVKRFAFLWLAAMGSLAVVILIWPANSSAAGGTYTLVQCDPLQPSEQRGELDPSASYAVRPLCGDAEQDFAVKIESVAGAQAERKGRVYWQAPAGTSIVGVSAEVKLRNDNGSRARVFIADGQGREVRRIANGDSSACELEDGPMGAADAGTSVSRSRCRARRRGLPAVRIRRRRGCGMCGSSCGTRRIRC